LTIRFERFGTADGDGDGLPSSGSANPAPSAAAPRRPGDLESDPMVQKVVRLFEARPIHMEVEEEREPTG
jgi:hypothetical protein